MARFNLIILITGLFILTTAVLANPLKNRADFSSTPDSSIVNSEQDHNLVISRLLSPNGDGVNDYWHIQGIDRFPENRVLIYNRWGDKVNVIKNYNNQSNRWDGKDEHNQLVPDGTYYYMLELTKERKSLNGWIYIIGG
ncbi:MAG: gliding motility-associated C-terminal domain-containing protein [Bacteroidales bacterium]|nr:gliding motility-associated C-terminal domain-containing protein [Bacteroidales bacterium]MDD3011706.1 gliding motility-associated C-terminal domain-containing protein [Bacteroidales bacterium]MDY0285812.1 gliding motility-associated C-terminal domain-containing protein [Bacteroidales bacterium]